jgi:hypothetical protein
MSLLSLLMRAGLFEVIRRFVDRHLHWGIKMAFESLGNDLGCAGVKFVIVRCFGEGRAS